ncbi:hypothetical protein [Peribacillus frigoritolerans]|uniref:hypothetical protein n=1 Tax=Peribacillus frigoritolerans TaxID=450367 RepID=UPI000FDB7F15|nr:hypothetical protein [Peribacillus frigoritolerans]AZV60935.1 hypothetical protein DOZ91_10080 [Peribacillus frigoritolerans]
MTRIPEGDRNMIEKAIYLPMVITVLNRDLKVIEISPFKLKRPYSELVEHILKVVQDELAEVRRYLRKENIKVSQIKRDESFTMYRFLYKGYEEHHNYFNPRLRNKTEDLLCYYFFEKKPSRD